MNQSAAYEILGLSPTADPAVIKAAYRALAIEHHPDKGGDAARFKEITAAYNAIRDGPTAGESGGQTAAAGPGGSPFAGFFSSKDDPVETHSAQGIPEYGITVEGEYITATITGVQHHADVRDLVFDHQLADRPGHNRTVILYDLHNTSDQILSWHSDESTYIDSDGYTFSRSEYLIDDSELRPPWTGFYVDIEGGARAKFIEIVERMPDDVVLSKVVHTLCVYAKGRTSGWVEEQERFEFVIEEADLPKLMQPPTSL